LAEFGHPVGLQIWRRDGSPELRIGVEGGEPEPLGEALAESWRPGGGRLLALNRDDARYILTSRLANENVVSVVAPPFFRSAERSGLGPLLLGPRAEEGDPLTVIPLLVGDSHPDEGFQWSRVSDGWQADMLLGFANDMDYHAHYLVSLPGLALAVARATLLLALNLVVFFLFWLIGQGLVGGIGRRDFRLSGRVISFRARVTLSLFGFFTLANALFGTVAYSTLSSASRRSAMVIAERVGEDASGWYRALGGRVDVWERRRTLPLARQVGADLLEYRVGELREAAVEELVELGLYEGWTPYEVFSLLESQEVVYGFTETSVGRWEYVTAYRRLPDGDILGAQVPLEAGTSALQATDLIELLGFFVLIGALLSLGLAMFAGRALTQPIRALQIASEKVGAGDLTQRLPENRGDEFGAVFEAFNRMVGRVHQVRRQLVRTSKRTQLIMDEAAVGMVAIDSNGKVTLANPRAEELLDGEVFVGSPLPETGPLAEVLTPWLTSLLKGALEEGGTEFQAGDRRVRVRVRRLGSMGTQPGVGVAMDDGTDELRSERVLAWGEMARQVAHEVKNPLTPIKLSIQHVRRAWKDSHPDFEDILLNNADAMLMEIERLAGIAQSFSSFGAPGGPVVELSRVLIIDVVNDVMALYRSSVGHIQFDANIDPTLPPVVARSSELKEVLVNLLENARMAGKVEGTLVSIVASRDDQEKVLLQVIDDGVGIAADTLPRIFEPQFSTRSAGAGLGLAIVQKLVRSWGGKVSVSSTLGEGTTVSLILRSWESRDVH
ncbi:MAG: ATP-binding protein, partial [Gemmatimonadetes bacterium]|nr:ATP-binding protein [Gemmatimonadota bacterium]